MVRPSERKNNIGTLVAPSAQSRPVKIILYIRLPNHPKRLPRRDHPTTLYLDPEARNSPEHGDLRLDNEPRIILVSAARRRVCGTTRVRRIAASILRSSLVKFLQPSIVSELRLGLHQMFVPVSGAQRIHF